MKDLLHTNVFCAGIELPMCSCKYGAPMGRDNHIPRGYPAGVKMHLVRLRFADGDYDAGGAYWGCGNPIYWAVSDKTDGNFPIKKWDGSFVPGRIQVFVRARDREDAARQVMEVLPECRVLRAKIGGRS